MTRKISFIIVTVVAALVFAVPAGARGSMIPECLESKALCEPAGSKPTGKPRGQDARPRTQPKLNTDGLQQTWRAGNHIMY